MPNTVNNSVAVDLCVAVAFRIQTDQAAHGVLLFRYSDIYVLLFVRHTERQGKTTTRARLLHVEPSRFYTDFVFGFRKSPSTLVYTRVTGRAWT